MARFRSKSRTVEAVQWFPNAQDTPGVHLGVYGEYGPYVVTAQGQRVFLNPGDWVVKEPEGQTGHYPIKADVFALLYEPLEGADA